MPSPMNVNPIRQHKKFTLVFPRNLGRGQSWNSSKAVHQVTWEAGQILVNSSPLFSLASAPVFLDFAYDQLDRPQVCYQLPSGESFIYFYNGLTTSYQNLSLGFDAKEPIICNDYFLLGTNTACAYLKSKVPYYRLQSDRYLTEYQWNTRQYQAIKSLGYCGETNSVQLILG